MSFGWKVFFCYLFISSPSSFLLIFMPFLLVGYWTIMTQFSHMFWLFSFAFWKISSNLFYRPFDDLVYNHIFNFQETFLFSDLCSVTVAYICFIDAKTYQMSIGLLIRIFQTLFSLNYHYIYLSWGFPGTQW